MSFIIDALKRVQKAKAEGSNRDKKVTAKTIFFPSGDSRKRGLLSSRKVISAAIFFFFITAIFSVLTIFYYNNKTRQIKPKPSMPVRPSRPVRKIHPKISSGMELQGPNLIILPAAETKGKKEAMARKLAAIRHNLNSKARPRKKAAMPVAKKRRSHVRPRAPLPSSPETATTHFNLGVSYQREGRLKEALKEYKKVIFIEPFNIDAYNNMGMVYKGLGDLDGAIACYKKAIAINPRYEKGHSNMAVALYLKGDLDAAISESKKAIAINPNDIANYNNLGLIYKKINRPDEAIESFLKALAIDPDYPPAHYNLALLLEDEGKIREAISHYQKFIELSRDKNDRELLKKVARHIELMKHTLN